MTQAHTPLPWKVIEHSTFVHSVFGNVCACGDPHASGYVGYTEPDIGSQYLGEAVANAALIVRAVNSHADMLAQLKAAERWLSGMHSETDEGEEHELREVHSAAWEAIDKMRAAIAKAGASS